MLDIGSDGPTVPLSAGEGCQVPIEENLTHSYPPGFDPFLCLTPAPFLYAPQVIHVTAREHGCIASYILGGKRRIKISSSVILIVETAPSYDESQPPRPSQYTYLMCRTLQALASVNLSPLLTCLSPSQSSHSHPYRSRYHLPPRWQPTHFSPLSPHHFRQHPLLCLHLRRSHLAASFLPTLTKGPEIEVFVSIGVKQLLEFLTQLN